MSIVVAPSSLSDVESTFPFANKFCTSPADSLWLFWGAGKLAKSGTLILFSKSSAIEIDVITRVKTNKLNRNVTGMVLIHSLLTDILSEDCPT